MRSVRDAACTRPSHAAPLALPLEHNRARSFIETVEGVTLHKMVNATWETIEETCRLDVMHDSAQNLFYVAAQVPEHAWCQKHCVQG